MGDGGFDLHFLLRQQEKIMVSTSVCTGQSDMPLAYRIEMGSNPPSEYLYQTKKPSPLGLGFGLAVLNLMYILG